MAIPGKTIERMLDLMERLVSLQTELVQVSMALMREIKTLRLASSSPSEQRDAGTASDVEGVTSGTVAPGRIRTERSTGIRPLILEYVSSRSQPVPPADIIKEMKDKIPTRATNREAAIRQALYELVKAGKLRRTKMGYSTPDFPDEQPEYEASS